MNKEFEEIVKLAKEIGWDTTIDEDKTENYSVFTFTLIKPYQLDFSFSVEAENNSVFSLLDNIAHYLSAYDVSEETYLRLDKQGHGKKGYPYDMEEVLKIFNYREEEIEKLVEFLTENYEGGRIMIKCNEVGICPLCESENLEYKKPVIEECGVVYPWTCECGAKGQETYNLKFSGHYAVEKDNVYIDVVEDELNTNKNK